MEKSEKTCMVHFLKRTLQNEGIAVDHLIEDDKYFTTLAFVEIDENGERKFSFARKPGADTQLRKEELDPTLLQKVKFFISDRFP